uniref:Uncharacterized protein n=1 Tax=Knipowitschia caucasica TaxID=637954 RepID=A0AAV2K0X8_KNICA
MAKELQHRYTDVREVLNTAAALDARFKTLPFLCEEERDATFKNIINEATQLWDQKEDTQAHDGTAMEETHTPHPSEEACDHELHASEYVPVAKKTKAMEDLFGDTYTTVSSSFTKTSKQRAEMEGGWGGGVRARPGGPGSFPVSPSCRSCLLCAQGDQLALKQWACSRTQSAHAHIAWRIGARALSARS